MSDIQFTNDPYSASSIPTQNPASKSTLVNVLANLGLAKNPKLTEKILFALMALFLLGSLILLKNAAVGPSTASPSTPSKATYNPTAGFNLTSGSSESRTPPAPNIPIIPMPRN